MREPDRREVHFEGAHARMTLEQHGAGVVVVRIFGTDVGEFGKSPLAELSDWLSGRPPVELIIDARSVRGASIDVSGDWAKWLASEKAKLRQVTMLTGSRFVNVTAEFVRRFADMQGTMRICTEASAFDAALNEALAAA